jgi:hypothetical protein
MFNKSTHIRLLIIPIFILIFSAACTLKRPVQKGPGFPESLIPDGIGVNIHFTGAPSKDIELMKDANIKLIRADLTWTSVEKKKQEYDFTRYDQLIDTLEKQGTRILFILDYSNKLYGTEKSIKTEKQRNGFASFAAEAAKRYKERRVIWEIWNEPNFPRFWGEEPNVDDYMALVEVTCNAIRKADPNSIIVAPALLGCAAVGFIKKCAERGLFEVVDGVSVHPYGEGGPEWVLDCYRDLRLLIDEYTPKGKTKPRILSSEWGWGLKYLDMDVVGKEGAELKQAAYLTRRFCSEALAGVACGIYYKWRENNHGLIRNNHSLKPSYTAFKVLNEQLTGFCDEVSRLDVSGKDKDFVIIFKGKAGKQLVAWCTEGTDSITIPFKGKKAKGVDFLGKPIEFEVKNNILNIELTEQPVFLRME